MRCEIMKKIIIMREPNLLWDEIIYVLQHKFPHYSVESYEAHQYEQMKAALEEPQEMTLVIIDTESKLDLEKVKQFYVQKDVKLAAWISFIENHQLERLFKLGLDGYLFSEMEEQDLVHAICHMLQGKIYIHPSLSTILLKNYIDLSSHKAVRPQGLLTPREWDVLALIVKGYKNKEIADRLFVSSRTVNNHVASILKKLNVPDKTNAALYAIKNKWYTI